MLHAICIRWLFEGDARDESAERRCKGGTRDERRGAKESEHTREKRRREERRKWRCCCREAATCVKGRGERGRRVREVRPASEWARRLVNLDRRIDLCDEHEACEVPDRSREHEECDADQKHVAEEQQTRHELGAAGEAKEARHTESRGRVSTLHAFCLVSLPAMPARVSLMALRTH